MTYYTHREATPIQLQWERSINRHGIDVRPANDRVAHAAIYWSVAGDFDYTFTVRGESFTLTPEQIGRACAVLDLAQLVSIDGVAMAMRTERDR